MSTNLLLIVLSAVSVRVLGAYHPLRVELRVGKQLTSVEAVGERLRVDGKWKDSVSIGGDDVVSVRVGPMIRTFRGTLAITARRSEMQIINRVPDSCYLYSVVASEFGDAPAEALKAQAVLARSVIAAPERHHQGYDFCDLTDCQVYQGYDAETPAARRAVDATNRLILLHERTPVPGFYSSTCGGRTADPVSIWPGANLPFLVSVDDSNYCAASPHWRWQFEVAPGNLAPVFGLPGSGLDVAVVERGPDHRARLVRVATDSTARLYPGWEFRTAVGRALGWNTLKSSDFEATTAPERIVFAGRGLGHGVGMCQWGARFLAEQGRDFRAILRHYFPECAVGSGR